jgi:hypothetical protein
VSGEARHPADLDRVVRQAVLGFVHRRDAFKPIDVADRVAGELGALPLDRIARKVKSLYDEGLLAPFGYRRRLAQERTRHGVVTAVVYAPPETGRAEVTRAPSATPTRVLGARPYAYLELEAKSTRRLGRQTAAIRRSMEAGAAELIRLGRLLEAVRALVGAEGLARYLERELGLSAETGRRMIRVARVFAGSAELPALALARPTLLYALSAPGFPAELREALLLEGALGPDGRRLPLDALRLRDVRRLKERHLSRRARLRVLDRQLAKGSPISEADRQRLLAERRLLSSAPLTAVEPTAPRDAAPPASVGDGPTLGGLAEAAEAILARGASTEEERSAAAQAFRALLNRLERG